MNTITRTLPLLAVASFITAAAAQEVSIPDPGLNAAVRDALHKPAGELTRQDMLGLTVLNAHGRNVGNLAGLETAGNLNTLLLFANRLTNFSLPTLTNLAFLDLSANSLTNVSLPGGMTKLFSLLLTDNRLTALTLPPDLTAVEELGLEGNPLTSLVLSEEEATRLPRTIVRLEELGIPVFKYPLDIKLTKLIKAEGAFRFGITGPPGFYKVSTSTDLASWNALDIVHNPLGGVLALDAATNLPPQKFYRARFLTSPPADMVFIPPKTFLMGSPTNEVGHQADEGRQTRVTLSHGFWIGKYEVTQREYLAVTGENPSGFPGDLDRPVESVSFFAASNYCVLRTGQDLAAGRIPAGTHYRLPTEAEWECAARAGSTNRFHYGDDPNLTDLPAHAWFGVLDGVTTHPVGQKLPNAWGLHDTAGNVWEWCQDWYGDYPGGSVRDPQGPANNPIGWKVIRGGAWESSEFDCRSASRWFEAASPFISDFIIGFRVVLVAEP